MSAYLKNNNVVVAAYAAAALAGVYFIRVHIVLNGGGDVLAQQCMVPPYTRASLYAAPYVPAALTGFLCTLAEFFLAALEPGSKAWQTAVECIGALAVPAAAGYLESARPKRSAWLASPLLWALAYQTLGGGIVLPLQLLAMKLTFDDPARVRASMIPRADAEGTLLGLALGYILPSVLLVLRPDHRTAAAWQPFPVYVSLIQVLYAALRRLATPAGARADGYWATQATYGLAAAFGLVAHVRTVASIINSTNFIKELQGLFIPSIFNLARADATLASAAWHLLKWDNALMYGATFATAMWSMEVLEKGVDVPTAIAFVQGIPAFGPGPVMAAAWIWRERGLRQLRLAAEKNLETESTPAGEAAAKQLQGAAETNGKASAVDTPERPDTPLRRSKRNRSKRVD